MKTILLLVMLNLALLATEIIKTNTSIDKLRAYKFETPQGVSIKIPKDTKLIISAFEKDTGALVNSFLDKKDKNYLSKKQGVYIADIHSMPTIITTLFALPKLKKYKHLIYLHYEDIFQTVVPNKEGKITIICLDKHKIKDIFFITTKEELEKVIEK